MTAAEAYTLFYGESPSPQVLEQLHRCGAGGEVTSLKDVRRLIMALDRQTYPTPAVIQFDADDITYATMDGFSLAIDAADVSVSANIAAAGTWEPALTSMFRRYLRPGWLVADIGANVG